MTNKGVHRTEEDVLTQAPIKVKLGGKDYDISPLVIKDSREWRKKAIGMMAAVPQMLKVDTDNPEQFKEALNNILVNIPDEVIDLFFAYASGLPREEIEASATDSEMATAFAEVVKIAFPLAESAPKALTRLYQ